MGRILIADDEPDMRALLADLMEEAGHQVIEAENGQVAIQQVQRESLDLMLLDIAMPIMDGLQVLQRVRKSPSTEALPVILLTAFPLTVEDNAILGTPNTYHVTKPWRRAVVQTAVRSALAGTELPEGQSL
jgi:CheY-like chemotaxis protein